jgi:hypothetical protein
LNSISCSQHSPFGISAIDAASAGYSTGLKLPVSSFATSGAMHLNLRPPFFTSTNRMAFSHFGHRGGEIFLAGNSR